MKLFEVASDLAGLYFASLFVMNCSRCFAYVTSDFSLSLDAFQRPASKVLSNPDATPHNLWWRRAVAVIVPGPYGMVVALIVKEMPAILLILGYRLM
jgi:hypothetical protein